jgi:hypothetical protein
MGEVHLYCLPVPIFDELLALQRHITSSFVFRPKHFCFIAMIRFKHSLNNIYHNHRNILNFISHMTQSIFNKVLAWTAVQMTSLGGHFSLVHILLGGT